VSFSDTPVCVATELARTLDTYPSVLAATIVPDTESPSGRPELEAVVKATARGTVPNSVTHAITRSSLGIAECDPANVPNHKRVVVR